MKRGARARVALAAVAVGLVVPVAALSLAQAQARRCFASVSRRDRAPLPRCDRLGRWLPWLAPLPFVGQPARRFAEELVVRQAVSAYLDAAVGEPDAAVLAHRGAELDAARAATVATTGRWRFDELGPPLALAEQGTLVMRVGDRRRLVADADRWRAPQVRRAVLRAALVEGEPATAVALAVRWGGGDNEELTTAVAALLCAGGEPVRGLDLARGVELRRAQDRKANFSNDFGGQRVVVEACARLASVPIPPVPPHGAAGRWDQRPRLVVMRARLLTLQSQCVDGAPAGRCATRAQRGQVGQVARRLLDGSLATGERLALLAVVADSIGSAAELGRLAHGPADGHAAAGEPWPTLPLLAADWLARPLDAPQPAPAQWLAAAARFEQLADEAAVATDEPARRVIQQLAARMRFLGVVALSSSGKARAARHATARLAELAGDDLAVLARANIALLDGEPAAAEAALARHAVASGRVGAALALTRAALALPDRAAAHERAKAALATAQRAGDGRLLERAEWLQLVTGAKEPGPGRVRLLPWMGRSAAVGLPAAGLSSPAHRAQRAEALRAWRGLLGAGTTRQQRAARYLVFQQGGDAPDALAAYLYGASRLLSAPDRAETWLDAVAAEDEVRYTARAYVFSRWRVARWRGDATAVARWRKRLVALLSLTSAPGATELWQQAGL